MATKKTSSKKVSSEALVEAYLDYLLEEGKPPPSVRKFCNLQSVKEKEFYAHFASFGSLESKIWTDLLDDTTETLESDADYPHYPAKQKLAAFYYTFLESALNQRSYILLRFPGVQLVESPAYLTQFRRKFGDFVKPLLKEARENKEVAARGRLNAIYPGLFYAQFLFMIDFWLKDESDSFERTDALVEKSVSLAFDLVGTQVIDSAVDFARFMAGESQVA